MLDFCGESRKRVGLGIPLGASRCGRHLSEYRISGGSETHFPMHVPAQKLIRGLQTLGVMACISVVASLRRGSDLIRRCKDQREPYFHFDKAIRDFLNR
jgi:hypothetical protein